MLVALCQSRHSQLYNLISWQSIDGFLDWSQVALKIEACDVPGRLSHVQALTNYLSKLRTKMSHQEKENGGKAEDILVGAVTPDWLLPCS